MTPLLLADIPVSPALTASSALLFGTVAGLVLAALFWYLYSQDTEIFWCNAYRCGIAGSAVLGAVTGLLLFYDWPHKAAILPLALLILLWNGCILRICKESDNQAYRRLLLNPRLWHLFGRIAGIVLLSCIVIRLCCG